MARSVSQRKKKLSSRPQKQMQRSQRKAVSGVPRHEVSMARPKMLMQHKDVTKESITAYLQPFLAYESRMLGGLPVAAQAQPAYGFWTRNVINVVDVAYSSGPNAGTWVTVSPWSRNQVTVATALDPLGEPTMFVGYDDPFHASITANFESIVCAYQGIRVKNLTPVLGQAGESFVGRYPFGDVVASYTNHRIAGTNFVKSSADPGVMLTLNYEGQQGITPQTVGNITDYTWNVPTAFNYDPQATKMMFRSQVSSNNPQTWELEIVTYYLSRPFATSSVFFAPVKHEVDMKTFDRAVDRALASSPDLSVSRNAVKDDGENDSIIEDLNAIWGGARSFGRLASAAWQGLTSFFGLEEHRRHLVLLSLLSNEQQLTDFRKFVETGTLADLQRICAEALAPPVFSPSQLRAIGAILAEQREKARDADFELLSSQSAITAPSQFRVNPKSTQRI